MAVPVVGCEVCHLSTEVDKDRGLVTLHIVPESIVNVWLDVVRVAFFCVPPAT